MFKLGWKIIVLIMIIMVIVIVGRVVLFPLWIASKVIDSASGVITRTLDPDNIIQNYEWFKQVYEDVDATDRKIENAGMALSVFAESAGSREGWSHEDKTEHARLNTIILGLRNFRTDLVAQYNARSRMVNRAIFKAGDKVLPERIE